MTCSACKETALDMAADNMELRGEVAALRSALAETRTELAKTKSHCAVIRRELRESGELVIPSGDEEEGYECPREGCYATIGDPFGQRFCAYCGARFDWYPTRGW